MSTLTYSQNAIAPATEAEAPARKSILRRIYESMVDAQMRRAEREIAAYIDSRGGMFTDETEREIMRRLTGRKPGL